MNKTTREERFELLKSQVAKKKLGRVYWFRIFFTLFLFLLLSWYIRQGKNNPFSSPVRVCVGGASDSWYIHCFKSEKRVERDDLLFLATEPLYTNHAAAALHFPKTATLVTLTKKNIPHNRFVAPPENWIVLNKPLPADSNIATPATWPEPEYLNAIAGGIREATLYYIHPFSEPSEDIYLEYHAIKIAVINSMPSRPEALRESPFKEKIDVVILNAAAPVLTVRETLRPRFIIVLPRAHTVAATETAANILTPGAGVFSYEIYRDSRRTLQVKKTRHGQ